MIRAKKTAEDEGDAFLPGQAQGERRPNVPAQPVALVRYVGLAVLVALVALLALFAIRLGGSVTDESLPDPEVIVLDADVNPQGVMVPSFKDVSKKAGIGRTEGDKTSSPSIADLDQDGWPELIVSNHARDDFEVFYGSKKGFKRTVFFEKKQDRHGTAVGDYNSDGKIDILLTIGGSNGLVPAVPVIGETLPNGKLKRIEAEEVGIADRYMRGVAARFADFDSDGDLDLFILSRAPLAGGPAHSVYENVGNGTYKLHPEAGPEFGKQVGMLVTDYDMDGNLDLVLMGPGVQVWKGDGKFGFTDVTLKVLPDRFGRPISGASELDFDNDGDFDLYISCGTKGKKDYIGGDDVLLENIGGEFREISASAKIPKDGSHIGITVADLNNDGFVDIFVPREGPTDDRIKDLILVNNGDNTFTTVENHGANGPVDQSNAAGAQAFDYNRDGKIDVVVGARHNPETGRTRLFENTTPAGNFIVVDLPPMNEKGDSSMDAVVTIQAGGKTFVRKAGSVGEFRTQSYIDSVHFGLGDIQKVDRIDVVLTTGATYSKDNVETINGEVRVGNPSLHK